MNKNRKENYQINKRKTDLFLQSKVKKEKMK